MLSLVIISTGANFTESQSWSLDEKILFSFRGKIKGNTESPKSNAASFDSDLSLQDIDLNHYVTLGVLQAEDRRPLLVLDFKPPLYRIILQKTPKKWQGRAIYKLQQNFGSKLWAELPFLVVVGSGADFSSTVQVKTPSLRPKSKKSVGIGMCKRRRWSRFPFPSR